MEKSDKYGLARARRAEVDCLCRLICLYAFAFATQQRGDIFKSVLVQAGTDLRRDRGIHVRQFKTWQAFAVYAIRGFVTKDFCLAVVSEPRGPAEGSHPAEIRAVSARKRKNVLSEECEQACRD